MLFCVPAWQSAKESVSPFTARNGWPVPWPAGSMSAYPGSEASRGTEAGKENRLNQHMCHMKRGGREAHHTTVDLGALLGVDVVARDEAGLRAIGHSPGLRRGHIRAMGDQAALVKRQTGVLVERERREGLRRATVSHQYSFARLGSRTEKTLNSAPEIAPAWPRTSGTPVLFALGRVVFHAASVKFVAVSNAPPPSMLQEGARSRFAAGRATVAVAANARVRRLRANMARAGGEGRTRTDEEKEEEAEGCGGLTFVSPFIQSTPS